MKWIDTEQIAIALAEKHPDVDPHTLRFTDCTAGCASWRTFPTIRSEGESEFSKRFRWRGSTRPRSCGISRPEYRYRRGVSRFRA